MIKLLSGIFDSFKELNPVVSLLLGVLTFITGLYSFMNEMWGHLIVKLAEAVLPDVIEGEVLQSYAFLNHCFPVQETFAFLSVYVSVIAICVFARVVKSWIPTVN